MLSIFKPATSETYINQTNLDIEPLTDHRTLLTDTHLNFNCKVKIENINLDKFIAMNNCNIQSLKLPELPPIPDHQPARKCSVSFNFSFNTSILGTPSAPSKARTTSPSSQCHTCKCFFKGRRGLNIHVGRNSDCKRNDACKDYHMVTTVLESPGKSWIFPLFSQMSWKYPCIFPYAFHAFLFLFHIVINVSI